MVCALAIAIQAWLVEALVRLSEAWQLLMFAVFSHAVVAAVCVVQCERKGACVVCSDQFSND